MTSLWATGAGAADAMIRSASFVSSADAPMTSAGVRTSSSPSTDASHRRTLATSSVWVSPSNDKLGMTRRYSGADPADRQHREPEGHRGAAQHGPLGAGHRRQHAAEAALVAVEV